MVQWTGNCSVPSGVYGIADFRNNYWGTTDTNGIKAGIYDFDDDFSTKMKVLYAPFLTDSNPVCPPPVVDHTGFSSVGSPVGEVNVFPNPFGQYCVIRQRSPQLFTNVRMHLYNVLGQQLREIAIDKDEVVLDQSMLNGPGVYYYQVVSGSALIASGKLVAR